MDFTVHNGDKLHIQGSVGGETDITNNGKNEF
jgi:hypothetical protein